MTASDSASAKTYVFRFILVVLTMYVGAIIGEIGYLVTTGDIRQIEVWETLSGGMVLGVLALAVLASDILIKSLLGLFLVASGVALRRNCHSITIVFALLIFASLTIAVLDWWHTSWA